jgi:hypothetical protein
MLFKYNNVESGNLKDNILEFIVLLILNIKPECQVNFLKRTGVEELLVHLQK